MRTTVPSSRLTPNGTAKPSRYSAVPAAEFWYTTGNAAENFAVLRHFTMNMLKNVKSKVGIKIRRQQAGWDDKFLLEVLFASPD